MTTATAPTALTTPARRADRRVLISAWAVPVMVVGQFAMLAIVPVAVALVATVRRPELAALRPWTGTLAGTYALGLILWAAGPDRARSLSKDLHPAVAAAIVAAALATVVAVHIHRRRALRAA